MTLSLRRPGALAGLWLAATLVLASCYRPQARLASGLSGNPDAPFALRDPRAGRPDGETSTEESRLLDEGMEALRVGDLRRAARAFRRGDQRWPSGASALGLTYISIAVGSWDDAEASLSSLASKTPALPAALEAKADLDASQEHWREAWEGYRAAAKALPDDERLGSRLTAALARTSAGLEDSARDALDRGELDDARRSGLALVDVAAESPAGYRILARTAALGGRPDDAWGWAMRAKALGAVDRPWREFLANLSVQAKRFGEAVDLFTELAKEDRSFEEKADEARFEFRIQNLPDLPRAAVLAAKVTRAQVASLLWWAVPEVRETIPSSAPDVATDVVDHPSRQALVRAIGLGFFSVSRDAHRMRVEALVGRDELAGILKRVALIAGRGSSLPKCLRPEATAASLSSCGILPGTKGRTVAGKEALRAIERAARAAREGEGR